MLFFAKNKKQGFTLLELLVVIAIIGIMASIILVSVAQSRTKARVAATKATLTGLRGAISMCCDLSTNTLNTAAGDVCSAATGAILPTPSQLGLGTGGTVTYSGATAAGDLLCSATTPGYKVVLSGHALAACNAAAGWIITEGSMAAPTGCN